MIIRPATTLNSNEMMSKATSLINEGTYTIVILKNGKYLGIISDKTLKTIQYHNDAKVEKYAWKAPVIKQEDGLEKIAELFIEGYRELPIIDGDSIIGIIRNTDVLAELIETDKIQPLKVEEVMNVPVEKLDIKQSIAKAASFMRKERKHHVVITENGKNVTVISSADIVPLTQKVNIKVPMGREKSGIKTTTLQSIVGSSPKLISITPSASIREAAKLMIKNSVSALLVEGEGKTGLITIVDIIKTTLPKYEITIDIVGLDNEDKKYRQDIYNEIYEFATNSKMIIPIQFIRLNVKKHSATGKRHKYSMKMLVTGDVTFELSSFGWKMFAVLKDILREAERKIRQEKDKIKGKKNKYRKIRSISIQIQEGDLYPGKVEE